jgi:hypothetical protein
MSEIFTRGSNAVCGVCVCVRVRACVFACVCVRACREQTTDPAVGGCESAHDVAAKDPSTAATSARSFKPMVARRRAR